MTVRHFLTLDDLSAAELHSLLDRARELKAAFLEKRMQPSLAGRVLAMIFEKSSTRTRVSFEAGMAQLGGQAIFLSPSDTQLGRGEPLEDAARVLSRMVDCILIRTHEHEKLERFAACSLVPVINGLSHRYHPCQLLADMMTYLDRRGSIRGKKVAWVGDGNNMCHSYINAARLFGFRLHIACPPAYQPRADIVARSHDCVTLSASPAEAASGADLVVTDVWASMGQEHEAQERMEVFRPFQVNSGLMQQAAGDALFMHCLPAHRGEEVTGAVIDGPQSVVWEEAGNRLHSQKALLEFLLR
ncbi:MAG: ornithine carbamoyltransferase [Gammaproteobacteria bacterium]|nr:ornithine carbamoyltransferase [Gammaproteobacteria bacterium]